MQGRVPQERQQGEYTLLIVCAPLALGKKQEKGSGSESNPLFQLVFFYPQNPLQLARVVVVQFERQFSHLRVEILIKERQNIANHTSRC